MRTVSRSIAKQRHRLLGVLLADGMPLVLPVGVEATDKAGVSLSRLPRYGSSNLLPAGDRRAGFLMHDFRPHLVGLSMATHTGWLRVDLERARWTPHSRHAFVAPPNKTLLLLSNGLAARWGYRRALREGRHLILQHGQTGKSPNSEDTTRSG